jgi:nucleotide-binding universal stress UspA family protein
MGNYGNILVAFDGSESGGNAVKYAVKLAKASEGCSVKVMTVMVSAEDYGVDLMGQSVRKEPAEKLMSDARDIAGAEGGSVTTGIEQGQPYERIVETAEAGGFDLIVMGRRGLGRLERMLMGSMTARVIGHTKTDVLVVPRDAPIGWGNVLVATDGSKHGEAASLRAVDFAKSYGGDLTAVSVVDVNEELYAQSPDVVEGLTGRMEEVLEGLRNKARAAGVKTETLVKEGNTHKKIVELAEEKKAGVIFMGSHGRKGVRKFLMGSVTEKVIGLAHCSVLVTKA